MQKKIMNFLTRQFGNPRGVIGEFLGRRMAKGNVYDAQWTISLLNIQPHHRVLEIGFGPGVSTQIASEKASQGFVSGIDHSETMVQAASRRNANAIQTGRMELKQGDVASLPYPDEMFDIAFALHSIYFWPEPVMCLKELRRVLKTGGLLAITIQPKDKWVPKVDQSIMNLYFGGDIASMFSEAGFRNIHTNVPPASDNAFLECIQAIR
jgi:SAM-dependent methyltransferase